MKQPDPLKIDRRKSAIMPRLLVWHGPGWEFAQGRKMHLAWKPKSRVGWRLEDYLTLRAAR